MYIHLVSNFDEKCAEVLIKEMNLCNFCRLEHEYTATENRLEEQHVSCDWWNGIDSNVLFYDNYFAGNFNFLLNQ